MVLCQLVVMVCVDHYLPSCSVFALLSCYPHFHQGTPPALPSFLNKLKTGRKKDAGKKGGLLLLICGRGIDTGITAYYREFYELHSCSTKVITPRKGKARETIALDS